MKMLKRNLTEFEYFAYTGLTSDLNKDGLHTGIPKPVYDDPVTYKGNISVPSGQTVQAFDGLGIRYTHVLLMDNPDIGITEDGIIRWKGELYFIRGVAPSLNVLSIALQQRTKDNGDQTIVLPEQVVVENG